MKVAMMMRDTEYRDAMIEMMSDADKDIFIEIAGSGGAQRESVILTDILPSEIEDKSLAKIRERTLFLSSVPVTGDPGERDCNVVFKYSSINTIMARLSEVYSGWSGDNGSISSSARIIAVAGESDLNAGLRCMAIARQIIYRHGGSILVMPLGYINDYINYSEPDAGSCFRRLMYLIDDRRDYPPDSFTFTDSYGISYLKLPDGINPLSRLDTDYLYRLIISIGSHFDTVMLDIGSAFSETNVQIIKRADHVLFFCSGRRIENPAEYLKTELRQIRTTDPQSESRELDDIVSEIYG